LDRLRNATKGGQLQQDIQYDAIGNRTTATIAGQSYTYGYHPNTHRLNTLTANGPSRTYDGAGNTLERGTKNYAYGAAGRMNTLTDDNNGPSATYTYNADGQRVAKTSGGTTTRFYFGLNGELLAETNGSGIVQQEYAYLDGVPVALFKPTPDRTLDPNDTDNDGLPNTWELANGLDPGNPADAAEDTDTDGLTNLQEYQEGTDPNNPDTDGDSILDGADPNPTFNPAWLVPILKSFL
jgi:YD repeat-containing protein